MVRSFVVSGCFEYGERFLFTDRAVIWDELEESLSEGSALCVCPRNGPGEWE